MAIFVENLVKTYKSNEGADVRALKGISFNLPDTGTVFILGKSGCGKSTLLNVLGGLDGFDDGDLIIDGKSIKDYKAKDSDIYRNDYVGFVFQENNLLEKDSVKRNVSLALELQNGKDEGGKVEAVLKSVGLAEFAEKKCNCLSGGQKQRVAIARALVKQPRLLLCDEPTGALDSETGAEIFNLLKEVSKERLVVVVSHDRESAEKYGDRIIELKDGEIISDSHPQNEVDVKEQTKTKHGGLRFVRAFTMGASYIIAKPVRMAICLLLCLLTFTCIGVIDTVYAYDRDKAILYTMDELDSKNYAFGKGHKFDEYVSLNMPEMTVSEAAELSGLLDVERCDYIYGFDPHYYDTCSLNNVPGVDERELFLPHFARAVGYVEADGEFLKDYGYGLVAGRLPENSAEIALPVYLFNFFKAFGYLSGDGVVSVNTYNDLIGKTVELSKIDDIAFTVTGIIDTNYVYKKQTAAMFDGASVDDESQLETDVLDIEKDVIHNTVFVFKGFNDYFNENIKEENAESAVLRLIAPYKGSDAQKLKNIRVYTTRYHEKPVGEDNEEGRCYHLVNYCAVKLWDAERTFSKIRTYSIYVIAAAVVITVLFLVYYAIGTIDEKRREIGILRALGASRTDILKITVSEHGIFIAVAVAISSAIGAILTVVLNNSFTSTYGFGTTLIKFGMRQFAIVFAVAILAVAVGVAFPLIKLLKKKPVDVIADRK